jgi:hypothetical protein
MPLYSLALLTAAASPAPSRTDKDCALLANAARAAFGLDRRIAPPLERQGAYLPSCDWNRLGLAGFEAGPATDLHWFRFSRPVIQGNRARVDLGVMWASRAGEGMSCTFERHGREWKLRLCARRWAS